MGKNAVGVYISDKYVDIAELGGPATLPRLVNFVRQEISAFIPKPGEPLAPHAPAPAFEPVASALRDGFKKLSSKPDTVHVIMRSGDVMIRCFDMPLLPKSQQQQAIRFESKKYIPFKMEEVVSDYKMLPSADKKQTVGVFFAAATKQKASACTDLLRKAGVNVAALDIIPFALLRVLLLTKKLKKKEDAAILYLDNDKESASIHVIGRDVPFFSRDLKIYTADKNALFEKLASEVRVSIDYYRSNNPDAAIKKIFICGEQLFPDLGTFIASELKIETESIASLAGIKGAENISPSSAISIGAALEGLARSQYSVNLSPLVAGVKQKKFENVIMLEAAAAAAVVAVVFFVTNTQVRSASDELRRMLAQGKDLPARTAGHDSSSLAGMKKRAIREVNLLSIIANNRISWTQKLVRLPQDMPEGVWLTSLSAKEKFVKTPRGFMAGPEVSLVISGNSFSPDGQNEQENISAFFASLQKDHVFMKGLDRIELGAMNKKSIKGYDVTNFSVSANSSPGKRNEQPEAIDTEMEDQELYGK